MAKICELLPKQCKVLIEASVISISNVHEFNKSGKIGRVADATIKDESGEIKLTLWNEEIDKISAGNTIKITNGYVNEWQGQKQLMVGRFGNLEVVK